MPNLAQTLKQEIARITRREINPMVKKQIQTVRSLKSQVAILKQQVTDLQKGIAKGGAAPSARPTGATATATATADAKPTVNFTGKGVRSQRKRLGLTQGQFAKLAGLTLNGIVKMESKDKLKPRKSTMATLTAIQGMNRQQALAKLEGQTGKTAKKRV